MIVSLPPGATTSFDPAVTAEEATVALTVLDALPVRADDARPRGKYVRRELAISWAKFPQLGLDAKDYIFARHLTDITYDSDGFTLRSGLLAEDMYTGEPVEFRQEEHKKDWRIEIDHIVSLKDVWSSGGHRWSLKGRNWMKVANDPTNLLPVARSANRAKGNRDAAHWLPANPRTDFRRRFVTLQVQVKARYGLSVTESEATAIKAVLAD